MKVFITQSNYIPWKGFFDAIHMADVYVVFDEMQYTKRDWRNRNKIKTDSGLKWLSIPVRYEYQKQKISDIFTANHKWRGKHLRTLNQYYSKTPFFNEIRALVKPLYESRETQLSQINKNFINAINDYLGIRTTIRDSSEFDLGGGKTGRLINICKQLGASTYLVGPSAANYLEEEQFEKEGIQVQYLDYGGYPEYPQLFGAFRHDVTILDLLFNTGKDAPAFMKSFKTQYS